jgi:hypothetical protein
VHHEISDVDHLRSLRLIQSANVLQLSHPALKSLRLKPSLDLILTCGGLLLKSAVFFEIEGHTLSEGWNHLVDLELLWPNGHVLSRKSTGRAGQNLQPLGNVQAEDFFHDLHSHLVLLIVVIFERVNKAEVLLALAAHTKDGIFEGLRISLQENAAQQAPKSLLNSENVKSEDALEELLCWNVDHCDPDLAMAKGDLDLRLSCQLLEMSLHVDSPLLLLLSS